MHLEIWMWKSRFSISLDCLSIIVQCVFSLIYFFIFLNFDWCKFKETRMLDFLNAGVLGNMWKSRLICLNIPRDCLSIIVQCVFSLIYFFIFLNFDWCKFKETRMLDFLNAGVLGNMWKSRLICLNIPRDCLSIIVQCVFSLIYFFRSMQI